MQKIVGCDGWLNIDKVFVNIDNYLKQFYRLIGGSFFVPCEQIKYCTYTWSTSTIVTKLYVHWKIFFIVVSSQLLLGNSSCESSRKEHKHMNDYGRIILQFIQLMIKVSKLRHWHRCSAGGCFWKFIANFANFPRETDLCSCWYFVMFSMNM